jgi:hypothetical protein
VCAAFHGPCPPGYSCDHIEKKDGDWFSERGDDRATNLRWANTETQRSNTRKRKQYRNKQTAITEDQSDITGEVWVQDAPRRMVSNMGRARLKLPRRETWGRKFTPKADEGQPYARMASTSFHRIVFFAFGGKLKDNDTVDHINGDRSDNRLTNLRASTKRQQQLNRKRPCSGSHSSLKRAVRARYLDGDWELFESQTLAAKVLSTRLDTKIRAVDVSSATNHRFTSSLLDGWMFEHA